MDIRKKFFYNKSGEAREQIAQTSCGQPTTESVLGHIGWDFEKFDPGKDNPVHGRGVELNSL